MSPFSAWLKAIFTYRRQKQRILSIITGSFAWHRLVVDQNFSELEIIDSAGLGELVVVHMWIRASGCSLKLAGANPRILHLLDLTNLLSVFDVHRTLDDALLSFQQNIAKTRSAVQAA